MTEINEFSEYKHTYSGEPSAPPSIYPILEADQGHLVRCNKIMEIEKNLRNEIEFRNRMYKHYSRAVAFATTVDCLTGLAALGLDITSVALIGSVIAAPLAPITGGLGIGLGALAISCIPIIVKLNLKAKKHLHIKNIAEAKLNTISDHCSKALEDSHISHEEFALITAEWDKYTKMKSESRNKIESEISQVKIQEYIKQGRQEAVNKLREIRKRENDLLVN